MFAVIYKKRLKSFQLLKSSVEKSTAVCVVLSANGSCIFWLVLHCILASTRAIAYYHEMLQERKPQPGQFTLISSTRSH